MQIGVAPQGGQTCFGQMNEWYQNHRKSCHCISLISGIAGFAATALLMSAGPVKGAVLGLFPTWASHSTVHLIIPRGEPRSWKWLVGGTLFSSAVLAGAMSSPKISLPVALSLLGVGLLVGGAIPLAFACRRRLEEVAPQGGGGQQEGVGPDGLAVLLNEVVPQEEGAQ